MDEAFTFEEFLQRYKLGRTATFEEIAAGRLIVSRVGRRILISRQRADEWLKSHERIPDIAKAAA